MGKLIKNVFLVLCGIIGAIISGIYVVIRSITDKVKTVFKKKPDITKEEIKNQYYETIARVAYIDENGKETSKYGDFIIDKEFGYAAFTEWK